MGTIAASRISGLAESPRRCPGAAQEARAAAQRRRGNSHARLCAGRRPHHRVRIHCHLLGFHCVSGRLFRSPSATSAACISVKRSASTHAARGAQRRAERAQRRSRPRTLPPGRGHARQAPRSWGTGARSPPRLGATIRPRLAPSGAAVHNLAAHLALFLALDLPPGPTPPLLKLNPGL